MFPPRPHSLSVRLRRRHRPTLEPLEARELLSLGSEFRVNTTVSGAQLDVDTAKSIYGMSVAVWADFSQSIDHVIRAQRYDATNNALGPELTVAHIGTGNFTGSPAVAMGPLGNFVVAWTQQTSTGDTNVLAQQVDTSGNPTGGVVQVAVGTFKEYDPDVAIDFLGRFVVSYTRDTNGNNPDVFAKRYDSKGQLLNVFSVAASSRAEGRSSVAVTPPGLIGVAYQFAFSSTDTDIALVRYTPSGGFHDLTFTANTTLDERNPSLALSFTGDAMVAYQKANSTHYNIKARRVSMAGAPGPEISVTGGTSNDTNPSVVIMPGNFPFGFFWVAYETLGGVKLALGTANGSVFFTQDAGSLRSGPSLSMDLAGHFLLGYTALDILISPLRLDYNVRGRFGTV